MIAPQSITSNLRRMSDQQLAQYAKMHANDPYVFPLAFQESQDRKNMRSEAMARQSGQMPPPVVQQDLAQMMPQQAPQVSQQAPQLPEEQGIGVLPAQNLQSMAGGGITGEPQHFLQGGVPYTRQTMLDIVNQTNAQLPKPIEQMSDAELNAFIGDNHTVTPVPVKRERYKEPDLPPAVNLFGQGINYVGSGMVNAANSLVNNASQRAYDQNKIGTHVGDFFTLPQSQYEKKYGPQDYSGMQDYPVNQTPTDNSPYTQPGANNNYPQQASTEGLGPAYAQYEQKDQPYVYKPPQLGPAPAMGGGIGSLASMGKLSKQIFNPDDYKPELMRLENETRLGLDSIQKDRELAYANRPLLGKKQEELLKAQEAKEGEKLESLKSMSLLDAGLSMLAGESPYAFVNIGKGGREGLKRYTEGMKEIEKARDLRDQAYAHIDDMRNAQLINDQDRALDSKDRAFSVLQQAQQHTQSGLMNLGIKKADIDQHLLTTAMTEQGANARAAYSANTQRDIANATLSKLPDSVLLPTILGEGNVQKGFTVMANMKHREELANEWAKLAYPPNGMPNQEFLNKYPNASDYVKSVTGQPSQNKQAVDFNQLPK